MRFLAVFAEPPAESPSTIKISHLEASRLSQLASFPLLSKEYFCFVSRLVLAFSSVLRILAAFSAQDKHCLSASPDSGQNTGLISSPVTLADRLGRILVVQLGLGLSLKAGIRMLDGDDGSHAVADVRSGKVGVLLLQDSQLSGIADSSPW